MLTLAVDVGTTTTHCVVHRFDPGDPARGDGRFRPRHELLFESQVHFTPRRPDGELDVPALVRLHRDELLAAGFPPGRLGMGAALVTGEAARCANAHEAVTALSGLCAALVSALAGGHAESRLSGRGSGAQGDSQERLRSVACLDIGGGTANLSRFACGRDAGFCNLRIGGRMVRFDASGQILSFTPVAARLSEAAGYRLALGVMLLPEARKAIAATAAELLLRALQGEALPAWAFDTPWDRPAPVGFPDALYVAGGVGELFHHPEIADSRRFQDLGADLAAALARRLPKTLAVPLPPQSLRATVVGVGEHALLLSGTTIHDGRASREALRDLAIVELPSEGELPTLPAGAIAWFLRPPADCGFGLLERLAERILALEAGRKTSMFVAVLESDLGKAFSVALRLAAKRRGLDSEILCLDCLDLSDAVLLDVGAPLPEGAMPVLARTLVFPTERDVM